MKRREFLVAAAAGTAFARASGATDGTAFPVSVLAVLDSGEIKLRPSGRGRWTSGNIAVQLGETPDGVAVRVRSPAVALRAIVLSWPMSTPELVLNDHWERTYGDVAWQKPSRTAQLPWYFLASSRSRSIAMGVRTGGSSMCSWQLADDTVRLTLDTASGGVGVQLGDRELVAAHIVVDAGGKSESAFQLLRRFTRRMCAAPRPLAQPVYGINDWYFAYGKNSDALILEHTELMAPLAAGLENKPFSVIDAGWFEGPPSAPEDCCFGADMQTPNVRFPDMATLAKEIRRRDMRPGLWTRPLCATSKVQSSRLLPSIAGRDDPTRPILDPTIPENLEQVANYFRLYRKWNYDLVKIDFTTYDILGKWGFEMLRDRALTANGWRMHDVSRTNAEIIRDLYSRMREAAGDTCLIGCNTVSHLSAGVFEINRIGDDTSGKEWDRTRKMGVNTLAFRGAHHGTFYAADADCVGLTPQVPWEKNRQWMDLVARSGTPLFISAQPQAVGAAQKTAIREAFERASRARTVAEPLDWQTNAWPSKWRLDGAMETYEW